MGRAGHVEFETGDPGVCPYDHIPAHSNRLILFGFPATLRKVRISAPWQGIESHVAPRRHTALSNGFISPILMNMKPSEALTVHRDELRQLVSRYGLFRPRIFGSVLTGKDDEDSDLDLLVEPGQSTSLLTLAGLKTDAEELLGVTVSVLTPNGLPPKFRDEVLQRAQPL
jgi:predicted nucleotidyltransferase